MKRVLLVLVLLLAAVNASAAFTPPTIHGFVTDTAGKLSAAEISALDDKLAAYRRCSSDQIAAFVTGTLGGESIDDVGFKTATAWKLGEAGKDNGVLLVIAPSERKVRIEVGRGLEGVLTDLQANDILRTHVSPNLKKDDFFTAVDEGTTAIAGALWKGGEHASCATIPNAVRPAGVPTITPPTNTNTSAPSSSAVTHEDDARVRRALFTFAFSFIAFFALTFSRQFGSKSSALALVGSVLFASFFGFVGGGVFSIALGMVFDKLGLILSIIAAIMVVGVRWFMARPKKARPRQAADGDVTNYIADTTFPSSSSDTSTGSSFDTSSSSTSSTSTRSTDSSFSGGDGGTFGGGGSSDSY